MRKGWRAIGEAKCLRLGAPTSRWLPTDYSGPVDEQRAVVLPLAEPLLRGDVLRPDPLQEGGRDSPILRRIEHCSCARPEKANAIIPKIDG